MMSGNPTDARTLAGATWMTGLALGVLVALTALDAIPSIVPLGDDVWVVQRPFGSFAVEHMAIWGPVARILNIWLIELVALADYSGSWGLTLSILLLRAVAIIGVYLGFRRGFAMAEGSSLIGTAVFAFTPPAFEGWSLLVTQGLALSAPVALYAMALFYRSLHADPASPQRLLGAVVMFLAALAFYELWIVAVPAFVGIAALASWKRNGVPFARAAAVAGATGITALAWLLMLQVTGYLDAAVRTRAGPEVGAAEIADLSRGVALGRAAFLDHHVWRIIEILRTGRLALWDWTALGVIGAFAALGASALVGWRLSRSGEQSTVHQILPLVIGAVIASYCALILPALGNPGFPNTSRFYYAPGLFVALAFALVIEAIMARGSRVLSRLASVAVGAFVLWSAALTRHYLNAAVSGARVLRETASAIAAIPAAQRAGGVLVIAPSAVGVFAASAVEPWSIRPAVRRFRGVDPEGILFLGACGEPRARPEQLPMYYRSPTGPVRWSAVVRHQGRGAVVGEDKAEVCEASN
jgi:hypothetical protein